MKKIINSKQFGITVVMLVLICFFSLATNSFFKLNNLFNIARQIAMLGIISVGFTFVLISGGIDLSIGYQISLVNVICATLMVKLGMNPVLAVFIGILTTTVIGLLNGIIITRTGLAPIIVTLAMQMILNGLSYILSQGLPIFGFPKSFAIWGQGNIGIIPIALFIMLICVAIGVFILKKTYFGRYFYAIGSNMEAAKLSGVNTHAIQVLVYSLCGLFTGIAGVIMLSRINSGLSSTGAGYEMDVLTAVVLGGVSINGGKGGMLGTFIGVLIIGILDNGLVLMNVNEYVQLVIRGMVLLFAVIFDTVQTKKGERSIKH
jgi:Ribose/xylose/arabinose/galactoside ABC-type transport systems, permease components